MTGTVMGYYGRRYRSWRSRGWKSAGPSKYSILNNLFGEGVNEIKAAFLRIDADALEELLADYGEIYGDSAQRYATNTYGDWQSGKTKLSGQTMERLVSLVPPYLKPEQRFSILQKVIKRNKKGGSHTNISVNSMEPAEGFKKIDEALKNLTLNDPLAHLPESVMEAAKWLYDDDITAARAMLAEAEKIENDITRQNAKRELELLKRTIANKQIKSATYTVNMPAGSLRVTVTTPTALERIWKGLFG